MKSVSQLCLTLCDSMDSSPPGSSIHGIFQARILEWVAIAFSSRFPDAGIKPESPTLQADTLLSRVDSVLNNKNFHLHKCPLGDPNFYFLHKCIIGDLPSYISYLTYKLFNLYAEYIMRNAGLEEAKAGIKIAGRNINNLRYADDNGIGEGNGTPLWYSCLKNPRDGGAWWAAIYGVAQSQTRLK